MSVKYKPLRDWTAAERKDADRLANNVAAGRTETGRTTVRNALVSKYGYELATLTADSIWSFKSQERDYIVKVALAMFLLCLAEWKPGSHGFLKAADFFMQEKTVTWFQNPETVIWKMPAPTGERTWSIAAIDSAALMAGSVGKSADLAAKSLVTMLELLVMKTVQKKDLPHLTNDLKQQCWILLFDKLIPSYEPRKNGFAPYAALGMTRYLDKYVSKQQPCPIPRSTMTRNHMSLDWGISEADSPEAAQRIEAATASRADTVENQAIHEVMMNGRTMDDLCREIAEVLSEDDSVHMERWLYAKGITTKDHQPVPLKVVAEKFGISLRTVQKSIQIVNEKIENSPDFGYVKEYILMPLWG